MSGEAPDRRPEWATVVLKNGRVLTVGLAHSTAATAAHGARILAVARGSRP